MPIISGTICWTQILHLTMTALILRKFLSLKWKLSLANFSFCNSWYNYVFRIRSVYTRLSLKSAT